MRLPVTSERPAGGIPRLRIRQLTYRKTNLRSDVRALTAISFCMKLTFIQKRHCPLHPRMAAGVSPRPCRTSDPSKFGLKPRLVARVGFVKALRAAHRWFDELLSDPHQEHRVARRPREQERALDPDDAVPRFSLSRPGGSPNGGRLPRGFNARRLTDLPMLWSKQWRTIGLREPISGAGRTRLICGLSTRCKPFPCARLGAREALPPAFPSHVRETEFCRQRLLGEFRRRTRANSRNTGSQTRAFLPDRRELRAFLPTRKPYRFARTGWWAMQGSNLRPLPCEGSALPLS